MSRNEPESSKYVFAPSRRHEIMYSKTYVMYLVPLAMFFTIAWCGAIVMLVRGVIAANGEDILFGAFLTAGGSGLVLLSWMNARRALRDRRIQKRQLR